MLGASYISRNFPLISGINLLGQAYKSVAFSAGIHDGMLKEKYHSCMGEIGKIAPNIINRDFTATAPLQKWTTDVSQFNFTWESVLICSQMKLFHIIFRQVQICIRLKVC